MSIKAFFSRIRSDIENDRFDKLSTYSFDKPVHFNWVEDIFYPLNVAENPNGKALIWRHNEQEKYYTFDVIYNRNKWQSYGNLCIDNSIIFV